VGKNTSPVTVLDEDCMCSTVFKISKNKHDKVVKNLKFIFVPWHSFIHESVKTLMFLDVFYAGKCNGCF
jgi:hypothetical protein